MHWVSVLMLLQGLTRKPNGNGKNVKMHWKALNQHISILFIRMSVLLMIPTFLRPKFDVRRPTLKVEKFRF